MAAAPASSTSWGRSAVVAAFRGAAGPPAPRETVGGGRSGQPHAARPRQREAALRLLVYAWKITGEGKGRTGTTIGSRPPAATKAICSPSPAGSPSGFGIDEGARRHRCLRRLDQTGHRRSSSVHIERATLDAAKSNGYAEQQPLWDSRAATEARRHRSTLPTGSTANADSDRRLRAARYAYRRRHRRQSPPTSGHRLRPRWLRIGDRLFLADKRSHT